MLGRKRRSPLPPKKPLPAGTVLCLDIDGVCAPHSQNLRFHSRAPHPGFVALPTHPAVHFHPALSQWLEELAQAFTHVSWVSSWRMNCATFAIGAGIPFAAKWPYLPSSDPSDETDLTGRGELPWGKLDAVLQWVQPDQPVAFVDDELVPQRWPYDRKPDIDRSVEIMSMRPGAASAAGSDARDRPYPRGGRLAVRIRPQPARGPVWRPRRPSLAFRSLDAVALATAAGSGEPRDGPAR